MTEAAVLYEQRYLQLRAVLYELLDQHVPAGVLTRAIRTAIERYESGASPSPAEFTTYIGKLAGELAGHILLPDDDEAQP